MPSPLDIVCFYAELGNPYYPLLKQMTESAKAVMPHARTVLLTPTPSAQLDKLFDRTIDLSREMVTTRETICYDRARATVSWQAVTQSKTVYSDPDILFRKEVPFTDDFDVGLLWRKRKPDQPINTGIVLAKPGCNQFWARYGAIVANLPASLRGWWCDQLAFSVLTGVCHETGDTLNLYDARVKLFDWLSACAPPEKGVSDPWALHMKGQRKWELEGKKAA